MINQETKKWLEHNIIQKDKKLSKELEVLSDNEKDLIIALCIVCSMFGIKDLDFMKNKTIEPLKNLDTNKIYKTGTLVFIEKSDIEKFQLSNLEDMDIFVKKAINKNGKILKGKDVDESNLQGFILFNGNYKNC